jgi:hypothetical protein
MCAYSAKNFPRFAPLQTSLYHAGAGQLSHRFVRNKLAEGQVFTPASKWNPKGQGLVIGRELMRLETLEHEAR